MTKIKMSENAKIAKKYFYDKYESEEWNTGIYKKEKGVQYNASFAADGHLFALLCGHDDVSGRYPLDWVLGMIDYFICDSWKDNDWLKKPGNITVPVFFSNINKMLQLGIQKQHWVKKHQKVKGLKPIGAGGQLQRIIQIGEKQIQEEK